jgi:hypothetical protein
MPRIFMSLVMGFFFVMGLFFCYKGVVTSREARASESWPTAPGEVLSSRIETKTRTSSSSSAGGTRRTREVTLHRPEVQYRYVVDGTGYLGNRITFYDGADEHYGRSQMTVARYPAGATLAVRYDPKDATQSVLEPGDTEGLSPFFILGGGFLLISSIGLVVIWVFRAEVTWRARC